MTRRRLEVADVVRAHRDDLLALRGGKVSAAERRALDDIAACRTAARGGHVEQCSECRHQRIAYNSCRNRHCPKCKESARALWVETRQRDLLPVDYFHVVFTIPHELGSIALQNRKVVYDLLFRASAETLSEIAADAKHLGAEIGFLAVLHTWGQRLDLHPHVHCVIPGGGLAPDGSQWVSSRPGFFLPVRVLGRLFRGKFLDGLRRAFEGGILRLQGQLADLEHPAAFHGYLSPLFNKDWVVYAKPPFGGPAHVLHYLARYTHRVAISNERLLALEDGKVHFRYKDYARHGKQGTMTLGAGEFLRRFLLHLLPEGFVRIRHYGFLANRRRRALLDRCLELIAVAQVEVATAGAAGTGAQPAAPCPECRRGRMVCVLFFRSWDGVVAWVTARRLDSS